MPVMVHDVQCVAITSKDSKLMYLKHASSSFLCELNISTISCCCICGGLRFDKAKGDGGHGGDGGGARGEEEEYWAESEKLVVPIQTDSLHSDF